MYTYKYAFKPTGGSNSTTQNQDSLGSLVTELMALTLVPHRAGVWSREVVGFNNLFQWGGWGWLGGGFKDFLFSPLFGEMIQFDKYFSDGLKPPARWGFAYESWTFCDKIVWFIHVFITIPLLISPSYFQQLFCLKNTLADEEDDDDDFVVTWFFLCGTMQGTVLKINKWLAPSSCWKQHAVWQTDKPGSTLLLRLDGMFILQVHPWKLTWQWKNHNLKMYILLKLGDFPASHVSLGGVVILYW